MFKQYLLVDNRYGKWVPFKFINLHPEWFVKKEDKKIILAGPRHEKFEKTWDEILKYAEFCKLDGSTHKLKQTHDGDLYAVVTKTRRIYN